MAGTQGQASDMEIAVKEVLKMKKELYDIIANPQNNLLKSARRF